MTKRIAAILLAIGLATAGGAAAASAASASTVASAPNSYYHT